MTTFVYLRKIAKMLRAFLETTLLILFIGGYGSVGGGAGAWIGGSLDSRFMAGDPIQLNHSVIVFTMVGTVAGFVLGLLFGIRVMLSPFSDKLLPFFDKRKREGVNSSR